MGLFCFVLFCLFFIHFTIVVCLFCRFPFIVMTLSVNFDLSVFLTLRYLNLFPVDFESFIFCFIIPEVSVYKNKFEICAEDANEFIEIYISNRFDSNYAVVKMLYRWLGVNFKNMN